MKRIFLHYSIFTASVILLASAAFAQDVALPDLDLPGTPSLSENNEKSETAEQKAPEPPTPPALPELQQPDNSNEAGTSLNSQGIESAVKEVFSEEKPAEESAGLPDAPSQPSLLTEAPKDETATPNAPIAPAQDTQQKAEAEKTAPVKTEVQNIKPSRNYAKIEITNKPAFSDNVSEPAQTASPTSAVSEITPLKPIEAVSEVSAQTPVKIEEKTFSSQEVSGPLFSGTPKSMQKTANLVVAGENGKSDIKQVSDIPIIPLDDSVDEIAALNRLVELPVKNRPVIVKNNINVERGEFVDPFYEELVSEEMPAASDENNIANPADGSAQANIATQPSDEIGKKAENKKNEKAAVPKSLTKKEFYVKDKSLNVQVKTPNVNLIKTRQDAYEALNIGMYESSISYYKKLLKDNPRDRSALFGLATSYHKSGQYFNAKKAYLDLINMDSRFYPAVSNYIILVTEENADNPIPKLVELWKKNPSFSAIPAQIANLYYKENKLDKAIEYYFQAVNLEPDNIEYKYNLAVILEKLGEAKLAAKYYKNLLDEAAKGKSLPENPLTIRDRFFLLMSSKS